MSENTVRLDRVAQPLSEPVKAQVVAFWEQEQMHVGEPDERLKEIHMLAWDGETLVGVASSSIMHHSAIDQNLHWLRVLVGSAARRSGLAYQLSQQTVELLEARFDEKVDIRGIGVFVEVQSGFIKDYERVMCTFSHEHSAQQRPVTFLLSGFSAEGLPQYIYYFQNASLVEDGPVFDPGTDKLATESGLELKFCWNQLTEAEGQQIIGLWMSHGVITDRERCVARLPQVAAVALEAGKIVAVSSIFEAPYEALQGKFYGFRSFSSPDSKYPFLATKLAKLVFQKLNEAHKNGAIDNVHGMAIVLQNDGLSRNVKMARGPSVGLALVGYLDGMQLRVRYFDDAAIERQP